MTQKKRQPPAGEIRQSQMLSTFGPGSMVDLPNHSVLIGGLNHWQGYRNQPIYEERLAARVCQLLGVAKVDMYAPPAAEQDPSAPRTGVTAFTFPAWFIAQVPDQKWMARSGKEYQTRPLVPWARLVKGKYLNPDRKKISVVPVRFVQACLNGHISEINWYLFVNPDCRSNCPSPLWLDEGGTGNDFADIFVRCEQCKKRRPLSDATLPGRNALGYCKGQRPWLGQGASEKCTALNKDLHNDRVGTSNPDSVVLTPKRPMCQFELIENSSQLRAIMLLAQITTHIGLHLKISERVPQLTTECACIECGAPSKTIRS